MARVYADLIIKGVKTFGEVPNRGNIREQVKAILIERGYPELMEGDN